MKREHPMQIIYGQKKEGNAKKPPSPSIPLKAPVVQSIPSSTRTPAKYCPNATLMFAI